MTTTQALIIYPVAMSLVSILYYLLDYKEENVRIRIMVSAHGAIAAIIFLLVMFITWSETVYRPWAGLPFLLVHIFPLASVIYAFIKFKGNKVVHLLQVVNLFCVMNTLFIGGMAVTGDWL